jgi:hypothetical protein
MSHGTEHHVEEAHHAEHASHDEFTKRVAMTMAIVAAALAFVTLLSHRAHNETIQYQIKSNDHLTEASDKWGYFQAKKNRAYMLEADAKMLGLLEKDVGQPNASKTVIEEWDKSATRYKEESDKLEEEAHKLTEEANAYEHKAHRTHLKGNLFDLGELGIELALVLCSIAVLTKRSPFWLTGIAVGVVGFLVALCAFVPPLVDLFETLVRPFDI